MKKLITLLVAILSFGCIHFTSVVQPEYSTPNTTFSVSIWASSDAGESEPYFGVCLPVGWNIPGDSIAWTGIYNESIQTTFVSEICRARGLLNWACTQY